MPGLPVLIGLIHAEVTAGWTGEYGISKDRGRKGVWVLAGRILGEVPTQWLSRGPKPSNPAAWRGSGVRLPGGGWSSRIGPATSRLCMQAGGSRYGRLPPGRVECAAPRADRSYRRIPDAGRIFWGAP